MKKLLHISGAASPHMVKFIPHLRKYFDAEFYFYSMPLKGRRADWWRMDLGEHGHVLHSEFSWHEKFHYSRELNVVLEKFNPDVIMLGGFAEISNYLAYRWGKRRGKRVVVYTEASRDVRKKTLKPFNFGWRAIRSLYRNVDNVMLVQQAGYLQFRDVFSFGDKVILGHYPSDLDAYFQHPIRGKKDSYTVIFPNRLVDEYNPHAALDIFEKVLKRHPKTKLRFNAVGGLRPEIERRINDLGIGESVEFLDNLKVWDDLSRVYETSDIMILPAKYSTGNYTISECMVSGMACLVSENVKSKVAESLARHSSGQVLPLDNDVWAEKICWYMDHPEEFQRIAKINRELRCPFTLAGTAKDYFRLFGEGA